MVTPQVDKIGEFVVFIKSFMKLLAHRNECNRKYAVLPARYIRESPGRGTVHSGR